MPTCCWGWDGAKNIEGYGRFRFKGKLERAHAVSLSLVLGYLPKYVMHLCDNPNCVRPSHLKEGTHGLNMRDAYSKNRRRDCTPKGIACRQATFTEDEIRDIRHRYMSGQTQAFIGSVYNVQQAHISQIVRRKIYSSVQDMPIKINNYEVEAK